MPPTNEAFLQEVDDELRRDQLASVWKRWGRWLVATVLLGLAAFAAFLYWDHQQSVKSGEESEKLSGAIEALGSGNTAKAESDFAALATSSNDGFRATSKMAQAGLKLQKGDEKGAATAFGAIAADATLPKPYRDLALIRQTIAQFDTMKSDDVITRLKPLAVTGNPWFGSAGELVAISYMRQNKPDLAGKTFAAIGKDETVPETIRSRAVQMAGVLGVDAVDTATKEKAQ
jgi:hypothetical protein